MNRDVLMLGGPTASGKTALGLHAAERLGGEIVNADSMQIYAGMDILSASPSENEFRAAPHHLFGCLPLSERCSVGHWAKLALEQIAEITARGKIAILIGGTGLYFRALEQGLAEVPTVSSDIVERLNARSIDELRSEAAAIDADAAGKIESGDRQRLIRLISVFRETGQTLSSFQKDTRPLLHPDRLMGVVIQPDRDVLYRRIEQRFDAMLSEGALDEARAIHRAGLDRELPALKAVGLRPLLGHLDGDIDLETAIDLAKRDSRRYAKRQFTWFANQHPHWARIDASDLKHQIDQLDKLLVHF